MKYILAIIFSFIYLVSFSQDTTYFDSENKILSSPANANFYRIILREKSDTNKAVVKKYFISGNIKSEYYYSDFAEKTLEGTSKEYYENGQLMGETNYKNGKREGLSTYYLESGKKKREQLFENNKLMSDKRFDLSFPEITGSKNDTSKIFSLVEQMPSFPGGDAELYRFLQKNIIYPEKARRNGTTGKVFATFVVNADGSISDIKIIRSLTDLLDKEVIRVIKLMPKWTPGTNQGKPVNVQYNLPVSFMLTKEH